MDRNKGVTLTIVTFIILILGLAGYFAYDYIKNDNNVERKIILESDTINLGLNERVDIRDYYDVLNVNKNKVSYKISDSNILHIEDYYIIPTKLGEVTITLSYKNASSNLKVIISK